MPFVIYKNTNANTVGMNVGNIFTHTRVCTHSHTCTPAPEHLSLVCAMSQ